MDYKDFTMGSETCKMVYIHFDEEEKEYVFGATKWPKTKGETVMERLVEMNAVVDTNASGNVMEVDIQEV